MWRLRKLRDESDLEGVLDGGRPADGGQEILEAGEILEPAAELGLVSRAPAAADRASTPRDFRRERHLECPDLVSVGGGIVAAKAARDSAHGIEDRAAVDNDERAGGANVWSLRKPVARMSR